MRGRTHLLLLALLLAGKNGHAARDLEGSRALALSNALRASANGATAVYLNPAGMSLGKTYVMSVCYQFRSSDHASQIGAVIADSVTSRIAAGLFYSFIHANPKRTLALPDDSYDLDETQQTHELGLSLSTNLGSWLTLGVSAKYLNFSSSLPDDDNAPDGLSTASISNIGIDVGAIVRLGSAFRVGIVGHNLVPVDDRLYPQSLGMGVAYSMGTTLLAEVDTVVDFTSDPDGVATTIQGGLEGFLDRHYAIRAGASHDTYRGATYVSAGGGVVTRQVGLEVGLRQQVNGGPETIVGGAIQVYVQ